MGTGECSSGLADAASAALRQARQSPHPSVRARARRLKRWGRGGVGQCVVAFSAPAPVSERTDSSS